MKTLRWLPISTLLALVLSAGPAAADKPHEHKDEKPKSETPKDKSEEAKKKVRDTLMKEVGLPEKKAKDAEAVLSKFAPERNKQFKEIGEQRKALRDLL